MANVTTLARPYAKAAFQFALESKSLSQWSDMIALLSNVAGQEKMQSVLASPALSAEQQAKTFIDVCGDALNESCQGLVKVLAKNKRLKLLPEISQLFEQLKADAERSVDVEITSAVSIDSSLEKQLADALRQKLNRDVRISVAIDKNLIGGVVIRAGDTVIDSSLRGRLTKLAEAMNS